MKIFMIGGTGLLGCEAATTLIKRGHQVKSVALPPLPEGSSHSEGNGTRFRRYQQEDG